jgi:hypothetical protein
MNYLLLFPFGLLFQWHWETEYFETYYKVVTFEWYKFSSNSRVCYYNFFTEWNPLVIALFLMTNHIENQHWDGDWEGRGQRRTVWFSSDETVLELQKGNCVTERRDDSVTWKIHFWADSVRQALHKIWTLINTATLITVAEMTGLDLWYPISVPWKYEITSYKRPWNPCTRLLFDQT